MGSWARRLPFVLDGADYCPRCQEDGEDVLLEDGWVRAPVEQGHWRGVRGLVCPECDYKRRTDHHMDV